MLEDLKQAFRKQLPHLLITHQLCDKNEEVYHVMLNRRLRNAMRPEIFYIFHDKKANSFVIKGLDGKLWNNIGDWSDEKLERFFYQDIPEEDSARYTMYDYSFYNLPKPQRRNLAHTPTEELERFFYDDVVSWFLVSGVFNTLEWYIDFLKNDKISIEYTPGKDFESYEIGKFCSIVKDKVGNYKLVVPATPNYPGGVLTQMDAPKSYFEKIYSLATKTYRTNGQNSKNGAKFFLTNHCDHWKGYTQLRARKETLAPEMCWRLMVDKRRILFPKETHIKGQA